MDPDFAQFNYRKNSRDDGNSKNSNKKRKANAWAAPGSN